jgi:AraC family transcriptional regulator, L-rhamnose operon regulatory protein RhaS
MHHVLVPEPLSVESMKVDQWTKSGPPSGNFTLILIQAGEGTHSINGRPFSYHPGDVFFMGVGDQYSFRTTQPTHFYWLSISPVFIDNLLSTDSYRWDYLKQPNVPFYGSIATDATDQENLQALVTILLSEKRSLQPLSHNSIVDSLMKTLFSILDRLFSQREAITRGRLTYSSEITQRVIAHICRYIQEPLRLRVETIAEEFNYSSGHLSALFRQQVGDSIQQFIIRHKLKLVAQRLCHTTMTVSQIADEFGFSDVCHLNKHFKRHYKYTPTRYRQNISG